MAVVKDYYHGNTHIRIHDDAYANLTEEEITQRQKTIQEHVNRLAGQLGERKESSA